MSDNQWGMVHGSTINFSEIGKLDGMSYFPAESYDAGGIVLFGGGRGGGKDCATRNKLEEWKKISLTLSEKKDTVMPSMLLVKLIGRIYENA